MNHLLFSFSMKSKVPLFFPPPQTKCVPLLPSLFFFSSSPFPFQIIFFLQLFSFSKYPFPFPLETKYFETQDIFLLFLLQICSFFSTNT